ncbi:hypothetical protein LTR27_012387 [Elasticomyces elasticus]|nr:hypothetical protein LTR27_012387 [Elasticomyces elasticus]
MHGYGRFAVLSNLEEGDERGESEVGDNDVDGILDPEHRETKATGSHLSGSDDPDHEAMFEPDVVCEACQWVFPPDGRVGTYQLRVDVANPLSCRLCEALLNVWVPESYNERYLDLDFVSSPREGYFSNVQDVIFTTLQRSGALRTARFGFHLFNNKDGDYPPTPSFTVDLPTSTRLEHSEKQIKKWLGGCKDHEACRKLRSEAGFIPSRLLEITRDNAERISIRLRSRNDFSQTIQYATLSHCWGSFMPLRLEESKIAQYRERIPTEEMSSVFRDAIDVAVALDISYIWIDSLCKLADILLPKVV